MLNVNYEKIAKLLKRPIGYILITISNENGYQKIALRRNLFSKKYTLAIYNSETKKVERKTINISIKDNKLVIKGLEGVTIESASYVLTNPDAKIKEENEIYRKADTKARTEATKQAKQEATLKQDEIVAQKDNEIKAVEQKYSNLQHYFTTHKTDRLKAIEEKLVFGDVVYDIFSNEMVNKGKYNGGYQMQNSQTRTEAREGHNILFVIEQLESISEKVNSSAFDNNKLHDSYNNIVKLYERMEQEYSEDIELNIEALYGFIAQELTIRLYNLCRDISRSTIDENTISYNGLSSYESRYYDDLTLYTRNEEIEDYFNSILEGVSTFIERVSGKDIREELHKRLVKQEIKPVSLKKVVNM